MAEKNQEKTIETLARQHNKTPIDPGGITGEADVVVRHDPTTITPLHQMDLSGLPVLTARDLQKPPSIAQPSNDSKTQLHLELPSLHYWVYFVLLAIQFLVVTAVVVGGLVYVGIKTDWYQHI
ncbi:hypothetical protein M3Y94_00698200 [Aphelenchoides besseyi]|nr:hypothetical protein M3Y94_00698200 [Aphelenchoides besseyi]KAI6231592.1 hypothetical protein M3Y95_00398200 [Aphelenchoides besseyi]